MPLNPIIDTPESRAEKFVAQQVQIFNNAAANHHAQLTPLDKAITNGLAAQGLEPAVTAAEIVTAMGAANIAKVKAQLAALTA